MNMDIFKDAKSKLTSNIIPNMCVYTRHVYVVIGANTIIIN